jgi:hypothetical protein
MADQRKRDDYTKDRLDWLDQVAADPELPASAFKVAFAIATSLWRNKGTVTLVSESTGPTDDVREAWIGTRDIADKIAMSRFTVMTMVGRLEERGHLEVDLGKPGRGHANHNRLVRKGAHTSLLEDVQEKRSQKPKGAPANLLDGEKVRQQTPRGAPPRISESYRHYPCPECFAGQMPYERLEVVRQEIIADSRYMGEVSIIKHIEHDLAHQLVRSMLEQGHIHFDDRPSDLMTVRIRATVGVVPKEKVLPAAKEIEQFQAKLTCMCGDYTDHSSMGAGHSPVSMYDHALDRAEEENKQLKKRVDQLERRGGGVSLKVTFYESNKAELDAGLTKWGELQG